MDYSSHQKYKSEHNEMEPLNNIRKNKILNVKNSILKFEKDFREKYRKEIEDVFTKPSILSPICRRHG